MDRDAQRAAGGARELASARTALLSPRYDVVPYPRAGSGTDMPRRYSNSSEGSVLPALAHAVQHPPPAGRAASPNAFKRTGWATSRSSPGEEPLFPGIDTAPRQRSRPLLDDEASMGSVTIDPDWNAFQPTKPAPRRPEPSSILRALSPPETALPQEMERSQLAYMEQMYNTINKLTAELEKERQDRVRLEDQAIISRLVTESEYAPLDAMSTLTPSMTELDDTAYGFSPMTRSPAAFTMSPRSLRPAPPLPHQSKRPIGTGASAPSIQLAKDQVELCAALGKNAELRIWTQEMERKAEKSSQELEHAQKQMKLAERRISNRGEKLRGLLKEKMHWQKELKDMRDQVVEEKMRQVDIFRRMEALKREHAAQLEETESTLRDATAENEELRAHVAELRAQQTYQAKRMEELARQAKEEKDSFTAYIAETRQRFKGWKENEANALRVAKEQALSNLKTEYDLKIARHQEEKQKLRDKVKDLEVSLKLMQKDRTLSPLELSLRKATILGSRDNGGTPEAELIESHARIRELETLLEHSQEYQKRQDNIIKVSEATISRLVQEREVTALENLSARPLTLSSASVGGDDLATAGSPLVPRSPRDVRKPSQYSSANMGGYEKSKSISLPRPSRSYSPSNFAVPDSVDGVVGRASPQERKSVRPEPLRMSTLDAIAPITPMVTPKPMVSAASPAQAIPPPNEVSSAKELYLVSELARLRDELEQVKMRQMQSTVATPQTAERIDARIVPNNSNKGGKPPSVVTSEPQDSDAKVSQASEVIKASAAHDAEASAAAAEDSDETMPSALASAAVIESEEPHTSTAADDRDPKDAAPASCSDSVPDIGELGDMHVEEPKETNTTADAPNAGEMADQAQLSESSAKYEADALEEVPGNAVDTLHASACHVETPSPAGSKDSYVIVESQSAEHREEDIGAEASMHSASNPEPAIPLDIEAVVCAAEGAGADPEEPEEVDTSDEHAGTGVVVITRTFEAESTSVSGSSDTTSTKEPNVVVEVSVGVIEAETTSGVDVVDAMAAGGDTDDEAQAAEGAVDSALSTTFCEMEPPSSDLVRREARSGSPDPASMVESLSFQEASVIGVGICAEEREEISACVNDAGNADGGGGADMEGEPDTTEATIDAVQPETYRDEEITEPAVAEASTESSEATDAGEAEELSTLAVEPKETKPAAELVAAREIGLTLPATAPPSASTEEPAPVTTIEKAELSEATTEKVKVLSVMIDPDSALVVDRTSPVTAASALETAESRLEAASEADSLVESAPSMTDPIASEASEMREALEAYKSAEGPEIELPGKDIVTACSLLEENKAEAATETGNSFATASEIFTDDDLKTKVMAAVTDIIDQCDAVESSSQLEKLEPSKDDGMQPSERIDEAKAAEINFDAARYPQTNCVVGEAFIPDEVIDLTPTDESNENWDTTEASDYVEAPPDASTESGQNTMASEASAEHEGSAVNVEAAVNGEPTCHVEVAHSMVTSDTVTLVHTALFSHPSEADTSAALHVSDPLGETFSPSTTDNELYVSAIEEPKEPTWASQSSGEADTFKIADATVETTEADAVVATECGSATGAVDSCDTALLSPEQPSVSTDLVYGASLATAIRDECRTDEIHNADGLSSGLRNFATAFCHSVLAKSVGDVATQQLPSNDASLEAHVPSCDNAESHVSFNEECTLDLVEATACGITQCHNSSTPRVAVEDTHEELDCRKVEATDDGDRQVHSSDPVGGSVTPCCSSEQDHRAHPRVTVSMFVGQVTETVLQHYSTRDSIQADEVRSPEPAVDIMPIPDLPPYEAVDSRDTVDLIKVLKSLMEVGTTDCEARSEVEAVVSGIIQHNSASSEARISESRPLAQAEPVIPERNDAARAELSSGFGSATASGHDSADVGSPASNDSTGASEKTDDDEICADQLPEASNARLRQPDPSVQSLGEATAETRVGGETSEQSLRGEQRPLTAAVTEELVEDVMRHAVLSFARNNASNPPDESRDHTVGEADSSDGNLVDATEVEQAHGTEHLPVTADLLDTEAEAALDTYESDLGTDVTSTTDNFEKSLTHMESPAPTAAANTHELPVSIEAVAQELAVSAVARAVASALVSVEIQLNMEHIDDDDDHSRTDDVGHDKACPAASPADTTTSMHEDAPPESAKRALAVSPPEIHQEPCDPNDDCAVADLMDILCSAVDAQGEVLEDREPCTDAVCERRDPTPLRDATSSAATADNAAPSAEDVPENENGTPAYSQPLHDDCAPATDEEACTVLHDVVGAVSDSTSSSVTDELAVVDAATPPRSEKETATECLGSMDEDAISVAVDDAVSDTIASLLVQVESPTQRDDTATAAQPSTEPLNTDNAQGMSFQTPSAQTADGIPSCDSSDPLKPTISSASKCDNDVQAVLGDICARLEQSSAIDQRGGSSGSLVKPLVHRRSSQSVLPTAFKRPATINGHAASSSDAPAPPSVPEGRRTSIRRATKRSGSILAEEQLLAWDISPSVVDAVESTVKRYASKRRASRRGNSEPPRIGDHSGGQNPHLLAYDMRTENGGQPFSLLDDEMLRIDPNPRRLLQDDEAEQASEIIAKRKKMHYEAYCKSMTQRKTPAFNYAPLYIKFEWSDFVVASPVSPSARPSPVQKLRLLLKKGVRLPCGQYVVVSAFVRPLEDGNENLRVQIYDSERVEEFIFDFFDDHIKKYVAGWSGEDDQARKFVAQLEFRREQGAVIIKLPEKIGVLDAHGRWCQSDNGMARCEYAESRMGSTIRMEQPEGDAKSEPRSPRAPSRRRVLSNAPSDVSVPPAFGHQAATASTAPH